jgi:CheY-like chemotaxis protein
MVDRQNSFSRGSPAISAGPRAIRILVAEDNLVNQTVIKRMLEKMGHLPTIAANGQEALDCLRRAPFDLVLMDVQMPVLDGLATTARIREQERSTRDHIPIIATTAQATKHYQERCLLSGMDGFLTKPLTQKQLEETLVRFRIWQSETHPTTVVDDALLGIVWDPAEALARLEYDQDLFCDIVGIFIEEAPKQLTTLSQAVEDSATEVIERIAHSLKSELSYLGLPHAGRWAGELEGIARNGALGGASEVLRALQREISLVIPQMQRVRGMKAKSRS